MKNILVCNQKGGVGKSLIADELVFAMQRCGTACSFWDLDSQGGTIHKTENVPGAEVQVIDTPGALQKDVVKWMEAADVVVIPFRPTSRDIPPLLRMMAITDAHAKGKPVLYVMNAWNRYRASRDFQDWFTEQTADLKDFQLRIIPQSELFVQAAVADKSVVDYAPNSQASDAIRQVTNWVRRELGLRPEQIRHMEGD